MIITTENPRLYRCGYESRHPGDQGGGGHRGRHGDQETGVTVGPEARKKGRIIRPFCVLIVLWRCSERCSPGDFCAETEGAFQFADMRCEGYRFVHRFMYPLPCLFRVIFYVLFACR